MLNIWEKWLIIIIYIWSIYGLVRELLEQPYLNWEIVMILFVIWSLSFITMMLFITDYYNKNMSKKQ